MSYIPCHQCSALMEFSIKKLPHKIFCSTRCAMRNLAGEAYSCSLCRMEFDKRPGKRFCSEQCMSFSYLFDTEMVQQSTLPQPVRWERHFKSRYGMKQIQRFVW